MVSTRRSGSLPSNNSKRSSSPSDDNHNKPSSPKRQKALSLFLSLETHRDAALLFSGLLQSVPRILSGFVLSPFRCRVRVTAITRRRPTPRRRRTQRK